MPADDPRRFLRLCAWTAALAFALGFGGYAAVNGGHAHEAAPPPVIAGLV